LVDLMNSPVGPENGSEYNPKPPPSPGPPKKR